MPYKDRKKALESQKRWRERNRERYLQYNKDYYRANIRPRKLKSTDVITKEEAEKTKKAKRRERRKKQIAKVKRFISNYKKNHCCIECGENDPACLVFHHVDPALKEKSISKLYKSGIRKVKDEIKKCIVLCANCHMKLHNK